MEKSDRFADVLALGRRLVQQLGKHEDDTLASWMAHHIAELMDAAENAPSAMRAQRKRECAEAIERLWHHRAGAFREERPFSDFDAVFAAMRRIDPKGQGRFEVLLDRDAPTMKDEVGQQWLGVAIGIERAADQLVRWSLMQAVVRVKPETAEWLRLAISAGLEDDQARAVRIVFESMQPKSAEELQKKERERLEIMRGRLQALDGLAKTVVDALDASLKKLGPAKVTSRPKSRTAKVKGAAGTSGNLSATPRARRVRS